MKGEATSSRHAAIYRWQWPPCLSANSTLMPTDTVAGP
jgi:hypothetical protein